MQKKVFRIIFGFRLKIWPYFFINSFKILLIFGICTNILAFSNKTFVPKWGFWGHQRITQLAVFTLPPELMVFFKKNINYLVECSVNPDKRRYAVVGEAPRHYIDLEAYNDSTSKPPLFWSDAVKQYGEDSLLANGIVPWAIQQFKFRLTEAFREKNARAILRVSADLSHYIADANVPLHTTRNYNGQLTGQQGIHAFWESRLPELYAEDYDMLVGTAAYEHKVANRAWKAIRAANIALDSVLTFEKTLSNHFSESQKYTLEDRNGVITKSYSREFSLKYHQILAKQVERQMRASVKMVGDLWFTCWVDAGQPDLSSLGVYNPNEILKKEEDDEKQSWLQRLFKARPENDN